MLETRFCSRFVILERIEPIAYMVALPQSMHVHNVIHIYLLKKCFPNFLGGAAELVIKVMGNLLKLKASGSTVVY